MDWVEAVAALRRDGLPGVLVTVLEVRGHAPRDAGAKMVVGAEQTWGSVGGGNLEISAIERARELLAEGLRPGAAPEQAEFGLSEHAPAEHGRQCCGGQVRLLLEPMPVPPAVAVFGLGHVGQELARVLSRLELRLYLVDSRAEYAARVADLEAGVARVSVRHEPVPEIALRELPAGTHVLVMTHDHAEDIALCDQALRTPGLGSIGLIGSAAKWSRFRRRLEREGHDAAEVARIQCPIGIPGIGGKEPAVIAISVAADLVRRLGQAADTGVAAPSERRRPRAVRGAVS